jgi:hypothetical protein
MRLAWGIVSALPWGAEADCCAAQLKERERSNIAPRLKPIQHRYVRFFIRLLFHGTGIQLKRSPELPSCIQRWLVISA